ncbi:MAG: hypothetical protein ACFBSE_26335 [Prochloraceae cyanobacterium]
MSARAEGKLISNSRMSFQTDIIAVVRETKKYNTKSKDTKSNNLFDNYRDFNLDRVKSNKQALVILNKAVANVNKINRADKQVEALSVIATTYSQIPNQKSSQILIEKAFSIVREIEDPYYQGRALIEIIKRLDKLSNPQQSELFLDRGLSLAASIKNQRKRERALLIIASKYINIDNPSRSKLLIEKALSIVEKFELDDSIYSHDLVLVEAALKTSEIENRNDSSQLLKMNLEIAEKMQLNSYPAVGLDLQLQALVGIASAYTKISQQNRSAELLGRALFLSEEIENIGENWLNLFSFRKLIFEIKKLNDLKEADKLLSIASKIIDNIETPDLKIEMLTEVASAYNYFSDLEQTQKLLKRAIKTLDLINFPASKIDSILIITGSYSKNLPLEKESHLINRLLINAEENSKNITDLQKKAEALIKIASQYLSISNLNDAERLLQKALIATKKINYSRHESQLLEKIASTYSQFPDFNSEEKLKETLTIVKQIEESSERVDTFKKIISQVKQVYNPREFMIILESIVATLNEIDSSYFNDYDFVNRVETLSLIALAFEENSRFQSSDNVLEKAILNLEQIQNPLFKSRALRKITSTISDFSQIESSLFWIERTLASAENINHHFHKILALCAIAEVYIKIDSIDY